MSALPIPVLLFLACAALTVFALLAVSGLLSGLRHVVRTSPLGLNAQARAVRREMSPSKRKEMDRAVQDAEDLWRQMYRDIRDDR